MQDVGDHLKGVADSSGPSENWWEERAKMKPGDCAMVVNEGAVVEAREPRLLRSWPVKSGRAMARVGVGGRVKLLHGPFNDEAGGRWWVVRVLTDLLLPVSNNTVGWMEEVDPDRPGRLNLAPASCPPPAVVDEAPERLTIAWSG
jgi:hypothetical protein